MLKYLRVWVADAHGCLQMRAKRKQVAAAAADKAEKRLALAKDELAKAQRVLKHASAQEALAERFRFDSEGNATHECVDGDWVVRRCLHSELLLLYL